jgi:putative membrane protein
MECRDVSAGERPSSAGLQDARVGSAESASPLRQRRWRIAFGAAGVTALAAVAYSAGAEQILDQIGALDWTAPLVFLPGAIGTFFDAKALGVALPRHSQASRLSLVRLTQLRLAGEAINSLTPTASLGGEPVKAHLLRREGIAATDAVAAVVVAKTALIASQIIFVASGLILFLSWHERTAYPTAMTVLLIGLAAVVVLAMVEVQRRGLVGAVAAWAARRLPRSTAVARFHAHAHKVDESLVRLYGVERRAFLASTAFHLAGWLVGVAEVLIILALLGTPVSLGTAFAIESLSGTIRALSFLIPGTIGVQEVGGVFICRLMGVPAVPALSLMLLKRARETVFALLGLLILTHGRRARPISHGEWTPGVTGAR